MRIVLDGIVFVLILITAVILFPGCEKKPSVKLTDIRKEIISRARERTVELKVTVA